MSNELYRLINNPNVTGIEGKVTIDEQGGKEFVFTPIYASDQDSSTTPVSVQKPDLFDRGTATESRPFISDHTDTLHMQPSDVTDSLYQPEQKKDSGSKNRPTIRHRRAKAALLATGLVAGVTYVSDAVTKYATEEVIITPIDAYHDTMRIPEHYLPKIVGLITKKAIDETLNEITG